MPTPSAAYAAVRFYLLLEALIEGAVRPSQANLTGRSTSSTPSTCRSRSSTTRKPTTTRCSPTPTGGSPSPSPRR